MSMQSSGSAAPPARPNVKPDSRFLAALRRIPTSQLDLVRPSPLPLAGGDGVVYYRLHFIVILCTSYPAARRGLERCGPEYNV